MNKYVIMGLAALAVSGAWAITATKEYVDRSTNAVLVASKTYTDAAVGEITGVTPLVVTNIANYRIDEKVADWAMKPNDKPQGMTTNAVKAISSGIITNAVDCGYLCTVEKAAAMTNNLTAADVGAVSNKLIYTSESDPPQTITNRLEILEEGFKWYASTLIPGTQFNERFEFNKIDGITFTALNKTISIAPHALYPETGNEIMFPANNGTFALLSDIAGHHDSTKVDKSNAVVTNTLKVVTDFSSQNILSWGEYENSQTAVIKGDFSGFVFKGKSDTAGTADIANSLSFTPTYATTAGSVVGDPDFVATSGHVMKSAEWPAGSWLGRWGDYYNNVFSPFAMMTDIANFIDRTVADSTSVFATNLLSLSRADNVSILTKTNVSDFASYSADSVVGKINGMPTAISTAIAEANTTYVPTNTLVSLNQSVQYVVGNGSALTILAPSAVSGGSRDWLVYVNATADTPLNLDALGGILVADAAYTNACAANKVTMLCFTEMTNNVFVIGRQELTPVK